MKKPIRQPRSELISLMPPSARGIPQIEVTFDIDANGILNVSAKDKGTGKEQSIRIEASSGLSDSEIEKMKKEAQENEEADKTAKERIDKLNAADSLIFQSEKQLKEFGEKLPADKKAPIEEALNTLKEAHKSEDLAAIDQATEALNTAWQAASQDIYNAQQQGADAGQPGGEAAGDATGDATADKGSDDEVTDVDFEEVK